MIIIRTVPAKQVAGQAQAEYAFSHFMLISLHDHRLQRGARAGPPRAPSRGARPPATAARWRSGGAAAWPELGRDSNESEYKHARAVGRRASLNDKPESSI